MDTAPNPTLSNNGSTDPEPSTMATEGTTPPLVTSAEDTTATLPVPTPEPMPTARLVANSGDLMEIGMMLYQEAETILKTGRKKKLRIRLGRKSIAELPLATGAFAVLAAAMAAVALTRLTVDVE
jgi:hypothetical protein